MNNIILDMLASYGSNNSYDKKNAIKEVIQETVLCCLSKTDFFKHAAFYGGTALRIFYGLDRFSEDLDFSLSVPDTDFSLSDYIQELENEIRSYGLNLKAEIKEKTSDSYVQSAFVKGNTREQILYFYNDESLAQSIAKSEVIKIKFEVDTNPPPFASYEHKFRLQPIPYQVRIYDMPSLFAGKIHAVLCRGWKNRTKGRDLYDYVFYLTKRTPVNLKHLNARLIDSGFTEKELTAEEIRQCLNEKFSAINYSEAKQDVLPFIKNSVSVDIWSSEFFMSITEDLVFND